MAAIALTSGSQLAADDPKSVATYDVGKKRLDKLQDGWTCVLLPGEAGGAPRKPGTFEPTSLGVEQGKVTFERF